jgi:hypothetical protein
LSSLNHNERSDGKKGRNLVVVGLSERIVQNGKNKWVEWVWIWMGEKKHFSFWVGSLSAFFCWC